MSNGRYRNVLEAENTPLQRFLKFHEENPHVYQQLARLARQWKAAGHRKIGIATLFEVLRWETGLVTRDDEGYKLNNSYRSRYARMLMMNEPDLVDFFEIRSLATERGNS